MRKDNPNYGPGSISTVAKRRIEAIKASTPKKTSLLDAITGYIKRPKNESSKNIEDRVTQEQKLKDEAGGRRK